MLKNVFCDFLNKEIRRLYGLYGNVPERDRDRVLSNWLNLAVFLSAEWAIIPVGFLAESASLQRLLSLKEEYLVAGVFKLSMRDSDIANYVARRRIDYAPYEDDYPPLFDDATIVLLQRYACALHERTYSTATAIRDRWGSAIESSDRLAIFREAVPATVVTNVIQLAARIEAEGLGFTWNAIRERLPQVGAGHSQAIRSVLHANFVRGYLAEYDLRVLTGLPFGWRDLGVQERGGYYDYAWLKSSLGTTDMLKLLVDLSPIAMLALRREKGFADFQIRYARICENVRDPVEMRQAFAHAAGRLLSKMTDLRAQIVSGDRGTDFVGEGSALAGFMLSELACGAQDFIKVHEDNADRLSPERISLEDIESFSNVRGVSGAQVLHLLSNGRIELAEDIVQLGLEEILAVPFHKQDWGGEINDLYTANLRIGGRQVATAFMLKGNGLKARVMEINNCGKNGDQLQRLATSPAELFIVQYIGPISEAVIADMHTKVRALRYDGKPASFCIVDGQETARLLKAYGKLS